MKTFAAKGLLLPFFQPISALFQLTLGVLLWRNLALHFAQIEEILPTLPAADLVRGKGFFFGAIGLALLAAIWQAARRPWKALFSGLRRPFWTLLAALLLLTTLLPLFWLRFGLAAWLVVALLGVSFFLSGIGLLLFSTWLGERLMIRKTASGTSLRQSLSIRINSGLAALKIATPWLPALLLGLVAVYFSGRCFERLPHVEDSIAQLLQGRIFATGHFTAEPFQPREFFSFGFMVDAERWFAQYPPGHPLMLALGVLAGVPYLINPLLGALSIVLLYLLLKELEGKSFAGWGAWLLALSPFAIFLSSEYMNHSTALSAALLGWLGLRKAEKGTQLWLFISGLAFGYCFSTRPLEGALFALIGGILLLSRLGFNPSGRWLKTSPYVFGFWLTASLYFIHNAMTTGNVFTTGYQLTWGGTGFGLGEVNWGPAHTLGYGLVNTFMSLAGLNVYVWEIPIPALLGVFLWSLLGSQASGSAPKEGLGSVTPTTQSKPPVSLETFLATSPRIYSGARGSAQYWQRAFLASLILVPLGYLFYYFHDYCFGPRYYYVLLPQIIYFSIKGVVALYYRLINSLNVSPFAVKRGLLGAGVILLALQVTVAMPFRARVYADGYWGTDDDPRQEARRLKLQNALLFIENHPWEILQTRLHSLGFIMGDTHRLLNVITNEGLDQVLKEMGISEEQQWSTKVDLKDFEARLYRWNETYLNAGNPPLDPWAEPGRYTYYSNGAVHLDPYDRQPDILLARDLGEHNRALLQMHPKRKAYRYAWDESQKRFRILPLNN